jgi:N-acetylmuramoyl-L-alanine amidase
MKTFKFLLVVLPFAFLFLTFSGCATIPPLPPEEQALISQTVKIGQIPYVPLSSLCKIYEVNCDWDIMGKKITLTKEKIRMKLALDNSVIMINERSQKLEDELRIYNGLVMIPLSAKKNIFEPNFRKPLVKAKFIKDKFYPSLLKTIVIDPGHGGKDPGAIGNDGLKEKEVTLDVAQRLARLLEERGVNVVLTRDSDKFISLWRRSQIANTNKASFFISIHVNSARAKMAKGLEVYYLSEATDDSARALEAAENASLDLEESSFEQEGPSADLEATLWDMLYSENRIESKELAFSICEAIEPKIGMTNRGVKSARFYVLKGTKMPAVLIELGFISNREEETRLANTYYRQELAEAVANGILSYFQEYEQTAGFSR